MRGIERFELLDRIGRELQARMSYSDIDVYLQGFGVDCSKEVRSVNSKWVYTKELLASEPDDVILTIADELDIAHGHVLSPRSEVVESSFWLPGHFRLFLSHLSEFKTTTGHLRDRLKLYGISSFVAHTDIKPTREWQDEIENALFSMDALAAILMSGFKQSDWTDQEVGVALGRGRLVIPITRGLLPYGFLGKYQALKVRDGMTVREVAQEVFGILRSSTMTRAKMTSSLINVVTTGTDPDVLAERLSILRDLKELSDTAGQKLREGLAENRLVLEESEIRKDVNDTLEVLGLEPVMVGKAPWDIEPDDDLPF